MLFLLIAGPYIPIAFDITEPLLLKECTQALRIYAIAGPGLAVVANFNSFYLNTRKPLLAALESILNIYGDINQKVDYSTGIGTWDEISDKWQIFVLKDLFPSLIPHSDDAVFYRTIRLEENEIMTLVYDVHAFLEKNHIAHTLRGTIELTLEELLFLIKDRNMKSEDGKKPEKIYAECFIRANEEGVDLSIWDSGEIFDITNEDSDLINFRHYIVERIMTQQDVKKHMVATSFNKNFFHFSS